MPTEQQLKTLNRYVDTIYEMLIDQINGINSTSSRQLLTNRHLYVRMFGQMLYDAPKLHTGFASIRLIEQKLKNFSTKACLEHHQSRQKGGNALVALIELAVATGVMPTKQQVLEIMLYHCQVHYTTVYENAQLRKHQRRCSSEAAYRRANIQLVEARDLFSKQGRHSVQWKQEMHAKYQPIVDRYNNPSFPDIQLPEMPLVIN